MGGLCLQLTSFQDQRGLLWTLHQGSAASLLCPDLAEDGCNTILGGCCASGVIRGAWLSPALLCRQPSGIAAPTQTCSVLQSRLRASQDSTLCRESGSSGSTYSVGTWRRICPFIFLINGRGTHGIISSPLLSILPAAGLGSGLGLGAGTVLSITLVVQSCTSALAGDS